MFLSSAKTSVISSKSGILTVYYFNSDKLSDRFPGLLDLITKKHFPITFYNLASEELKAIQIEGVDLHRHFYMTWQKHRTLTPLARLFMEFIEKGG